MESKETFVGNRERVLALSKIDTVQKCTASTPAFLGTRDGVHLWKTEMVVGLDTAFPTKAGGITSALVIFPLDGGKVLKCEDATVEFDCGPMWIYRAARMFSVESPTGDKKGGRKSAAAEVAELRSQLNAMMAMLAKLQK